MATESQRESATIYTFPARGRFAAGGDAAARQRSEQRPAPTMAGSGWYHDEAIREEQARKNR